MSSNDFKSPGLSQLKSALEQVKEQKQGEARKPSVKHQSLLVPFLKMGVFFLVVYCLLIMGIDSIESSFLEKTADYENRFKTVAERFASLALPAERGSSAHRSNIDAYAARPLICWNKSGGDGRIIARLQYRLPEKRQPQTQEEVDLVVRLTLRNARVYVSTGKFSTKFPIYDVVVDYIDPQKNVVFKSDIVKGDPTSEGDRNRIAPGTVPMVEVQELLQQSLGYSASFALYQLQ